MSDVIPFLSFNGQRPVLRRNIDRAIKRVRDSNNYILGEEVSRFEKAYAEFSGIRYCTGVGNGFDAILLSLKGLDIGNGDEVIVPANTCVPTWMAVAAAGATIVPIEPNLETYNIDVKKIEAAITSKTKAIIPVHLFGQACEMSSISKIAKRHDINIVEDNAQAHGAEYKGKRTGTFGIVNATSFYPTKNLGALGDGGAITTNNRQLYEKLMALRNYGSIRRDFHVLTGLNSRLDELQAAVLYEKLLYLDKMNAGRFKLAAYYHRELADVGDLILPEIAFGSTHVYYLFVVRTKRREKLRQYLRQRNIETMIHYPVPPHLQKAFDHYNFKRGDFPITEAISSTSLSLPLWPGMSKNNVEQVVAAVRSFYKR